MNEISVFEYGFNDIRVSRDENGDTWFVAKDVCDVLDILWKGSGSLGALDDDEKASVGIIDTSNSTRKTITTTTISESGLYTLIIRSNKSTVTKSDVGLNQCAQLDCFIPPSVSLRVDDEVAKTNITDSNGKIKVFSRIMSLQRSRFYLARRSNRHAN